MSIFNFIKSQVTILDVISEYTTLKKNGAYWKGCCPFHHEKTASFTVSPHKEIFYCFGCHMTGDAISFIEKMEQCSPLEAAYYLAQRFNIAVPESVTKNGNLSTTKHHKELYFMTCKLVAQWCQKNLEGNQQLNTYLHQRGFNQQIIHQFSLGYFPSGVSAMKSFLEFMHKHTILAKDLIDAHIIMQGKQGLYSSFEERIVFPIKDHLGNFCGFGGRIFKAHDDRPKYYNSKENEFFTKGSLLFGFDQAKRSIQEHGAVFLVEGYTDCMAMVQHGYAHTVATLGTACTIQHLKTLSRYAQQVYLLYDNDNAGQAAIMRLTQLCWHVDLELKVITLPRGQDPASWLQNNTSMETLILEAKDLFLFFIDMVGKDFSTKSIVDKVHLTRNVVDVIRTVEDSLKQDFLLQKAAKIFDIPFMSLKQELLRSVKGGGGEKSENNSTIETKLSDEQLSDTVSTLEKQVFCAILNNRSLLKNVNVTYVIDYLPQKFKTILHKFAEVYTAQQQMPLNDFFTMLNSDDKQWLHRLLFEQAESIDESDFEQLLYQLQKIHWKNIVRDVKIKIANAQQVNNRLEVERLLQDFLILKNKMVPSASSSYIQNK